MNRLIIFFTILFFSSCTGNILYKKYSQIPEGKIYLAKCSSCHQIRTVENYSIKEWQTKLNEHEKRIHLNEKERIAITELNETLRDR